MVCAQAQTGSPHKAQPTAQVQSVRVTAGEFGPVLEILATHPLTPAIQVVENPLRLVVDLPNSTDAVPHKRIAFRNEQIKGIRVDQNQPTVTRIVVDLNGPVTYTWDGAGNRVRVRIHGDEAAKAKPPSVPAFTSGTQPAAVPVAVGNSGTLVETGSRVGSGSSITAGQETAVLRLTRGGEVRVCPGTTVSVTTSPNGQDMMLGMSKGAMETHYGLQESVDSVLTPDFRIVLPGPGEFNLAISTDARGNTCVGSLNGSTSSAVVAELLGSGTYEIKPEQQVLFRQGRLDSVETPVMPCGCPPAQEPVLRTENNPADVMPEPKAGEKLALSDSTTPSTGSTKGSVPDAGADVKPVSNKQPDVTFDSPLVFSGRDMAKARTKAPPPPLDEVAALHMTAKRPEPLPAVVVIPPEPEPKHSKGFFGKVKGFFGGMFR
jgi:hypothetical protein